MVAVGAVPARRKDFLATCGPICLGSMPIDRRQWLRLFAGASVAGSVPAGTRSAVAAAAAAAGPAPAAPTTPMPGQATAPSAALRAPRVRPTDAGWPGAAQWAQLRQKVGPALVAVRSPWAECRQQPDSAACAQLFKSPQNPYALGDDPALTQTFGWVGAWT